jgi:hypothetical protein
MNVAGATGGLGRPAVSKLLAAGHEVTGLARSADSGGRLERKGARAARTSLFELAGPSRDALRAPDRFRTPEARYGGGCRRPIQAAHVRFARAAWSEPRDVPSLPDDVSGTALRRRAGIGPRPRGATQARAWRSRWPTPGGKSAPPPPGSARGRAQLQEVAAKHHVMPYPQRVNRPAGLVFKARARCPASRGSRSPGHGSRRSIS